MRSMKVANKVQIGNPPCERDISLWRTGRLGVISNPASEDNGRVFIKTNAGVVFLDNGDFQYHNGARRYGKPIEHVTLISE